MITNFIFDIDGTLIDTSEMYMPAMIMALADFGYHYSPEEEIRYQKELFGINGHDSLVQLGIPEDQLPDVLTRWYEYTDQRKDFIRPLPGMAEALEQLVQQEGVQLAIATSKKASEYEDFKQRFAFAKYFKVVIKEEDTLKHKPDPEPLLAAMHDLGGTPDNTIYVGDTINDLKAAHAAGMKFAGALYGSSQPEKIQSADFLLQQPADLLTIK